MHALFAASALALALFAAPALATLDLNTATKDDLVALPGIGPAKAQAIVDDRKANGPFKSVDDLKRVKGVRAATVERLRAEVTVKPVVSVQPGPTRADAKASPAAAKGDIRSVSNPPSDARQRK